MCVVHRIDEVSILRQLAPEDDAYNATNQGNDCQYAVHPDPNGSELLQCANKQLRVLRSKCCQFATGQLIKVVL